VSCRSRGARDSLKRSVRGVGRDRIAYSHERALGSPREIRYRLREDGDLARFFSDFVSTSPPSARCSITWLGPLRLGRAPMLRTQPRRVSSLGRRRSPRSPCSVTIRHLIVPYPDGHQQKPHPARPHPRQSLPQASKAHEETVCCAGISEDGTELLRLFPIRFRRLPKEHQFERFDLVEMTATKASDPRPESYRVDEASIRLIERSTLTESGQLI